MVQLSPRPLLGRVSAAFALVTGLAAVALGVGLVLEAESAFGLAWSAAFVVFGVVTLLGAVVGSGWGAYITKRPETIADVAAKLDALIEAGHVRPLVGARFKLEDATQALQLIDGRGATGKVVLEP